MQSADDERSSRAHSAPRFADDLLGKPYPAIMAVRVTQHETAAVGGGMGRDGGAPRAWVGTLASPAVRHLPYTPLSERGMPASQRPPSRRCARSAASPPVTPRRNTCRHNGPRDRRARARAAGSPHASRRAGLLRVVPISAMSSAVVAWPRHEVVKHQSGRTGQPGQPRGKPTRYRGGRFRGGCLVWRNSQPLSENGFPVI